MKVLRKIAAILCVAGASLATASSTIVVNSLDGEDVEVSTSEILRAYYESFEGEGFNRKIENGDGSIAVINPVFEYAGKKIPVGRYTSEDGLCRHYGFTDSHGVEARKAPGPSVLARMANDGTLNKIEEHGDWAYVVQVIVCSNRS